MYYDLKMIFLTASGKEYTMTLKNVKNAIASLVPTMMQGIISSNIVTTDYGALASAKSATLLETTIESISI